MSLPTRPAVREGTDITSAGLDAQYDGFATGSTDINAANLREFAVDLPNLPDAAGEAGQGVVLKRAAAATIGTGSMDHSTAVTVASYGGVTFPTPHIVEDGAGNETPLALGASGWAMSSGDVLRVYWDLSVRPRITKTGAGQSPGPLAPYGVELDVFGSGSTTTAGDGQFAWLIWLQWDVTSAALLNFVPVPGQSNFDQAIPGVPGSFGDELPLTAATSPVAPWIDYDDDARLGQIDGISRANVILWRGVSGAYFYVPVTAGTVYGLRIVIAGVAHARNSGGINFWSWAPTVHDGGDTRLEYTSGGLTAILHRGVV